MENPGRKWLFFIPVIVGVTVLAVLVKTRSGPEIVSLAERATPARVIAAPSVQVIPRIVATGTVEPATVWQALAQVDGQVEWVNPQLQRGSIIEEGALLLRIDPTDYRLALAQAEAATATARAQLEELDAKAANTRASQAIEEEALRLGEKELQRKRGLLGQGTVSRSEFELEQRNVLALRQSVQAQRNTLNLIPAERQLLDAELARSNVQREQALRDLARTEIRTPLTGRVSVAEVDAGEFVRRGEILAELDGTDQAEIPVQVPITQLRELLHGAEELDVSTLIARRNLPQQLFSAQVQLEVGDGPRITWAGRVDRILGELDTRTRTVGIVVVVDRPYDRIQPGVRPPLVKGLFVEVELRGLPRDDLVLVPRDAVQDGAVYALSGENRLERRPVQTGLQLGGYAGIVAGIEQGERVVISDLVPAIDGMLIEPVDDPASLEHLIAEARGKAAP